MESIDTILSILEFLEPEEIIKICSVNKQFQHVCNSQYLWKQLYIKKYINTEYIGFNSLSKEEYEKDYKKAFKEEIRRHNIRKKVFDKYPHFKVISEYVFLFLYSLDDDIAEYIINNIRSGYSVLILYNLYLSSIYLQFGKAPKFVTPELILQEISRIKPNLEILLQKVVNKQIKPNSKILDLLLKYCVNLRIYHRDNIDEKIDYNLPNPDIMVLLFIYFNVDYNEKVEVLYKIFGDLRQDFQ